MTKKATLVVVCLFGLCWFVQAGDLEPPGAPAPTMVTLQEIYDECTGGGGPYAVPKTGQTGCSDQAGSSIDCAGTGQDGEYQLGVTVAPRFTGNLDGTVTDNLTGLIWLQDADCFGMRNWNTALSDANALADGSCGLTDGSIAGAWRVPNYRELSSLIDYGQSLPALQPGHPFTGVQGTAYWSSTSIAFNLTRAWWVDVGGGGVSSFSKTDTTYVWPVRGGQ